MGAGQLRQAGDQADVAELGRAAMRRLAALVAWFFTVENGVALLIGGLERGSVILAFGAALLGVPFAVMVQQFRGVPRRPQIVAAVLVAAGYGYVVAFVAVGGGWPAGGLIAVNVAAALGASLAMVVGPMAGVAGCLVAVGSAMVGADDRFGDVVTSAPGALVTTAVAAVFAVIVGRGLDVTERELRAADVATTAREVAARRWDARRRLDRHLHDTVLSTLSLLTQPDLTADAESLRQRCREDLAVLLAVAPEALEALDVLDLPTASDDEGGGVFAVTDLEVHCHGVSWAEAAARLNAPGHAAVTGAVKEALRNIQRHGGGVAADVVVMLGADEVLVQVVDVGPGFDPTRIATDRLGIRDSIMSRMVDAGGSARIWSRLGAGTTVMLRVPANRCVHSEPVTKLGTAWSSA